MQDVGVMHVSKFIHFARIKRNKRQPRNNTDAKNTMQAHNTPILHPNAASTWINQLCMLKQLCVLLLDEKLNIRMSSNACQAYTRDVIASVIKQFAQALTAPHTNKPITFTTIDDNESLFLEWEALSLPQDDGSMHYLLLGTDDSHAQKLEKENHTLNYILTKVPGFIFWKDKKLNLIGCNENFACQVGLDSTKAISGKSNYELPWDLAQTERFLRDDIEVMTTGQPKLNFEEIQRQADGTQATLLTSKVPIYDIHNRSTGILGMYVDITDQKTIELLQQLRKEKKYAELADQLKTEFIRNMEHDIRTPLGGIAGLATILSMDESDIKRRGYLHDIVESAHELLTYCNSIINYSQIAQGKLPLLSENFSIRSVIDKVITIETPAAHMKGLLLQFECDENVPNTLTGDPRRLQQILLNLVSNAIKFTHQGHVSLNIQCVEQSQHVAYLSMTVQDTGIGIPADKHEMIFEKFNRVNPANSGCYSGTGLGLGIVKQFAEELGGNVTVTSELGKGSTFTCLIPFILTKE